FHFEKDRTITDWLFWVFEARLTEVKDRLGPQVELERWDKGWVRIHETVPYTYLDEDLLAEAAEKLARMIAVLQPIYEEETMELT
ncbi:MAG: hypothetical protein ACE5NP_09055, partial [Anaerolineae bacterium]